MSLVKITFLLSLMRFGTELDHRVGKERAWVPGGGELHLGTLTPFFGLFSFPPLLTFPFHGNWILE